MKHTRILGFVLAIVGVVTTFVLTQDTELASLPILSRLVIENYSADTLADNSVASVYLNYRIFDTIFEALMLLVSVMGVIHFSRHEHHNTKVDKSLPQTQRQKKATINGIAFVIPIIFMLGFYLIVRGHSSPGGGFQGGAALSGAFICVYLLRPEKQLNFFAYEGTEKLMFLTIAIIAIAFAVSNIYLSYPAYNIAYLIVMNTLIGIKVFCGLTIVFYRFVHYEDT